MKRKCHHCGRKLLPDQRRYCSQDCVHRDQRKCERPYKAELVRMLESEPVTQIARHYGVSDNTVRKWCKAVGAELPKRGYWRRKECGRLDCPPVKELVWRSRARRSEVRPRVKPRVTGEAVRTCLACGREFRSHSIANRICQRCSASTVRW